MFRNLLFLFLPATLLVAQGAGAAKGDPGEAPAHSRLIARLNAIRTERIKASLGIPDPLAKSIADQWGAYDMASHERRQAMRAARQRVQEILLEPATEEAKNLKLIPIMAQFSAIQKQQKDAKQRFEEEIQRMLTPVQQGRFIILMEDFQRSLVEAMADQRREK